MNEEKKKRFVYILESATETRRLDVEETDIITNADGEMDAPLDRILRKHHLDMSDLFQMHVVNISFAEEDEGKHKTLRSISIA